jgi:hypothetical protein
MRTRLSGICLTANPVAEKPRNTPPTIQSMALEAIKPPSRRAGPVDQTLLR